jgi:hypothetical protein
MNERIRRTLSPAPERPAARGGARVLNRRCAVLLPLLAAAAVAAADAPEAPLPAGVRAVWDLAKAQRERSPARERVCLNGLWRWQPGGETAEVLPTNRWGWFKAPGSWPGIGDYMQKDTQTVHPHPDWREVRLSSLTTAWYERTVEVPAEWTGHRQRDCHAVPGGRGNRHGRR